MQFTTVVRQLGRNDAKLIRRDSFLLMMMGYAIAIAIVLRYAMPWLNTYIAENTDITFDLVPLYPMMVAFAAIFMGGMMAGLIFGFVLLDEKDDNTLTAMLVTPVPLDFYLGYRTLVPALLGFLIIIIQVLILSLPGTQIPFWQLILIALGGAMTAPISALFFATFAENKVQGFALTKFTGTAGLLIIFAWFVDAPLQYAFGLFPPYWIAKAYWLALDGSLWWIASLVFGMILQGVLAVWLLRRFNHAIYN